MKHYLLALGGTGGQVLESLVWAASAGTLTDGAGKPIETLTVLLADPDAACGSITRALRAAASYEQVRTLLSALPYATRGFRTALRVTRWDMARVASVAQMTADSPRDQLLAQVLFDPSAIAMDMGEGLHGHAELGALLFSALVARPEEGDAFAAMAEDVDTALSAGEGVKVLLCGSAFGGTGAAGIPVLARHLRTRFHARLDLLELGTVLMLPDRRLPEPTEGASPIDSPADSARAALAHLGASGLLREGAADTDSLCDAVYVLGLPERCFVTETRYAPGGAAQANDARLTEWLAARCAAHFLQTDFRTEAGTHISGYCYGIDDRRFGWAGFHQDSDTYRRAYGGLLKTAALLCCELEPVLRWHLSNPRRLRNKRVNYWAAYFRNARHLSAEALADMLHALDDLTDCMSGYAAWMLQIIRTLPPQLRSAGALEAACAEAGDNYRLLLEAAGHVTLLERELERLRARQVEVVHRTAVKDDAADRVSRALAEAREELHRLEHQQQPLDRRIGGQAKIDIIKAAQCRIDETRSAADAEATELRQRLAREKSKPGDERDVAAMRTDTETLHRQLRQLIALEGQHARCAEELRMSAETRLSARPPELTRDELAMPGNDLFDPAALALLEQVLRERRAGGVRPRTAKAMEKALHHLVAGDRVTAAALFDRLGDGAGWVKDASPLACLLAQVLELVMEEGC